MAKVEFRPDVDIRIPDAAFEYAERLEEAENIKLRELIKKRIRDLKQDKIGDFHYEINMLQTLLKESKK